MGSKPIGPHGPCGFKSRSRHHARLLSVAAAAALLAAATVTAEPPPPYGRVPSARQLAWHERERYGFLQFTVNTFTGHEWGLGDAPVPLDR